jgi:hypothetical protein
VARGERIATVSPGARADRGAGAISFMRSLTLDVLVRQFQAVCASSILSR